MENTNQRRVAARGIIQKDGRLFCQELKDENGQGCGFWCTPGGGLEYGESLIDGITRELVEETGVVPRVGKLLFVQQFSENGNDKQAGMEYLEFFFNIENSKEYETINEQASHFDAEVSRYGFIDPKTENVLPKFLRELDIAAYVEHDNPVYLYEEFAE